MLTALCVMGRIVWANTEERRRIIFHRLNILSLMMKCIFFHGMKWVIPIFADQKETSLKLLKQRYEQGQLPMELIRSLFAHVSKNLDRLVPCVAVSYQGFKISQLEGDMEKVFLSFLKTLEELSMIWKKVEENLRLFETCGEI